MLVERKVALITGSATGIGRAVALNLDKQGINIIINYSRSEEDAVMTEKDVKDLGVECLLYKADVSNDIQIKEMIESTLEKFNRLDYLVNCAGTTDFVDLKDLDGLREEHWDKVMNVNVKGLFFTCRAVANALKETHGSIVNITSVDGITGIGSSIAYAASKAAAISATKSLACVLAPEVRVNSVAPGIVLTRWVEGWDDYKTDAQSTTPLQKLCRPEDVAEVVVGLLNAASMVTGQTIVVDGGKINK
ncbi:MAG: 3-ketoacyl-ACP reductase [Peptococcaceae bacterium BICA1-8]|nr:MAG: 3-ketoacyl-ACP reductase [Peptococcaceae bacterium BICA1-8]